MIQFRFEIDHLGSSGGMELFHPGKGFEITFHINFGSFYENLVQDAAIFIVQTAQNCSNRSVNWEAWNILGQGGGYRQQCFFMINLQFLKKF